MPYFQGFSNGDYKICESIARQTAEPSINFSGLLYRGIGGLVCRGISGLASGGIGGIVCAEYPLEQRNNELRERRDAYEAHQSDWGKFKSEYNHDMDGLGAALKDFSVDNKK